MLTSLCCFWLLFVFVVRCLMCAGGLIVAMGFAGLGWVYMVLFLFAVGVVLSLWWAWRFWFLLLIVVRVMASECLWWVWVIALDCCWWFGCGLLSLLWWGGCTAAGCWLPGCWLLFMVVLGLGLDFDIATLLYWFLAGLV